MGLWGALFPRVAQPGRYGTINSQGQMVWLDNPDLLKMVFVENELERRAKSSAGQGMEYNGCPWCGGLHPNCKGKE